MMFGENILSRIPADWQLNNGYMTSAIIALDANGSATQVLDITNISTIPNEFYISIITNTYVDPYAPFAYVQLKIITDTGQLHTYSIPIIDTGDGFCIVSFPVIATEYSYFSFTIYTTQALIISDWVLAAPVSDDVDLSQIREEIPRLLADYNTTTYSIGQREENIALISARLLANTDVSGHLQIEYDALQSCAITIRIKDNGGSELFTPLIYDVKAGKGSIGIPHAFLTRLAGVHTFSVTAQCSVGSVIFYTRSILFTVDAGFLATRMMDIDTDLQDIALQRLPIDEKPSSIFAIGVDKDGIVRVRKRPYTDNASIAWEPVYEYGAGITAAIEFNGTWHRPVGSDYFTLLCEEHPWIFWVDLEGNLRAQYGPNEAEAFILATGVSKVKAVRGFKSEEFTEQDQGLIVVYLKNGLAYYRNYCVQAFGNFAWEEERALPQLGSDITDIHVHRLNDYRVGIVSTTPLGNKWIITERMYIAGATAPENLRSTVEDLDISVTALNYTSMYTAENIESTIREMYIGCTEPISPVITDVYNILNETESIYVEFSHNIFESLTNKQGYFTLLDNNNVSYQILSTEQGSSKAEIKLNTVDFVAATNPMTLIYNNGITGNNLVPALSVDKDNVRFAIPNTSITFDALKEPPTGFISDNISAHATLVITVTQVHYTDAHAVENISASGSMASVLVTNVGTDPL